MLLSYLYCHAYCTDTRECQIYVGNLRESWETEEAACCFDINLVNQFLGAAVKYLLVSV